MSDIGLHVLKLIRDGLSAEQMVSQGLVRMPLVELTRMVRQLSDTRPVAAAKLDAAAARAAEVLIASEKPRDAIALLRGRGVLLEAHAHQVSGDVSVAVRTIVRHIYQTSSGGSIVGEMRSSSQSA